MRSLRTRKPLWMRRDQRVGVTGCGSNIAMNKMQGRAVDVKREARASFIRRFKNLLYLKALFSFCVPDTRACEDVLQRLKHVLMARSHGEIFDREEQFRQVDFMRDA